MKIIFCLLAAVLVELWIFQVMTELLAEVNLMNEKFSSMNQRLESMDKRLANLEIQQDKTNLELGELRLSNMKLADRIVDIVNHEIRIIKLEDAVFRKASLALFLTLNLKL